MLLKQKQSKISKWTSTASSALIFWRRPAEGLYQNPCWLYYSACFLLTADSVLLRDVQVLTLYKDRYTTAQRSKPIPQLQCVGGSAGCQAFVPDVIQCQNKGWDGVDVQVRTV